MNKTKYVFAQLVEFLDKDKFRHLVDKYGGNGYVKNFTCWNQLLALMFGQLSISLTDKTPLRELFEKTEFNHVKERFCPLIPGLFD